MPPDILLRKKINIKLNFVNDVNNNNNLLLGKSYNEAKKICKSNFCELHPDYHNGVMCFYRLKYIGFQIMICVTVENNIITQINSVIKNFSH